MTFTTPAHNMSTNSGQNQIPEALSGKFKGYVMIVYIYLDSMALFSHSVSSRSFAYKTLTDRLPVIITKAIDLICRQRKHLPELLWVKEKDRLAAEEETKNLIEELARLKYELQTNKPFQVLTSDYSDTKVWNDLLKREEIVKGNEEVTWFNVSWLYAECYLYRRMREIFLLSEHFKEFDQFYQIKEEAFFGSQTFASNLASHLLTVKDLLAQQSLESLFYFYIMVCCCSLCRCDVLY